MNCPATFTTLFTRIELCSPVSSPYLVRPTVPYLETLPWLVAKCDLATVVGYSWDPGAASSSLEAESVLLDSFPDDPADTPWFPDEVTGNLTVLGTGAGVLRSRGLSALIGTISLCFRIALDNDEVLRNVDEPGVPLNRTIRRGYGL